VDYGLENYLDSLDDDSDAYGYPDGMWMAEACENPRKQRTITANVANLTIATLETPQERVIVAYTPPSGARLVWDTPRYGLQLVEVDMRHNGKVWVFGYLNTEIEPRWFYEPLPEDAAIMPAPGWLEFAVPVDREHVARMQRNTTHKEYDNGEFVRRVYR
jgi:hypothetical protein